MPPLPPEGLVPEPPEGVAPLAASGAVPVEPFVPLGGVIPPLPPVPFIPPPIPVPVEAELVAMELRVTLAVWVPAVMV